LPESLKPSSEQSDRERYFRTDRLNADLKKRSVRGGAVTLAAQACKFTLQMGSTVILARLLAPQDYGLVGMVTAVTGFIALFKDMGLSMATIQKAEINHRQISNLFWVNVAVSVLLTLVTCAISPAIAWFYNEPRLILITIVSTIGFLFGGLTVQHQALLNRQMQFTTLAAIDIGAMCLGVVSAVALAWYGIGYWALVVMQIAIAIAQAIGVWVTCRWRPSLPSRNSDVRSLLAFGGNITGFNVINYFSRNLDNILIGRYWGAQQLGLYAKAYQLLLMPLQQINAPIAAVALPALSRLAETPDRYRLAYLRILEKLTMLTMPGIVLTFATSDWIVSLLLGSQWMEASRIFSLLAIVALTQPVANTTGWLFITQGRTQHMLQWGMVGGSLAIASILAGLPWGAVGVAASYSISGLLIRTPLLFWFVGRAGSVRAGDLYRTLAPSTFASLCALLALLAFRQWIEISHPLVGLAIASVITVVVTLSIFIALPVTRAALFDFKSLVHTLSQK
jgi:O-antigen/teichoic acid export membrane protein